MATTQEIIADLFRDNVPYALSLNERLVILFASKGVNASDLFRNDLTYLQSFNSRMREALTRAGLSTDLFRDSVGYQLSLSARISTSFGLASVPMFQRGIFFETPFFGVAA